MKNTFGNSISLTLFGESHGAVIGAVLDGLAPGIAVDTDFIKSQLDLRRPYGDISTTRHEADEPRVVSGVFEGKTTGTPLCVLIENTDVKSRDYSDIKDILRPGHADFTAREKYHGFSDYRGGGHFSGRLTAPLVAAGAIVIAALRECGILIGSHIKECRGVKDTAFSDLDTLGEAVGKVNDLLFPVLDGKAADLMRSGIREAAAEGDSVGGILETAVIGVPAGVGEPWFDSFEGVLSHGIFSIPAVKGIEFGEGFNFARLRGSEANDAFAVKDGKVITLTNHNGGVNGGITNGMPIIFSTVIKPTPSIYKEQDTVDVGKSENITYRVKGRHDPAVIHRARVVVDSVTALVTADMLAQRYGTDFPNYIKKTDVKKTEKRHG